jgi:antitoxin PrlF
MEIAKVTQKGQITVPVDVLKRLNIKAGDKILFVEEAGRIYIMNASVDELKRQYGPKLKEAVARQQ